MTFKSVLLTQRDDKTCGEAILRMLLAYAHKSRLYLTLPLSGNLDNMLALSKKAKEFGVILEGRKYEKVEDIQEIKTPFIMQIAKKGVNHFLFIKVKKGKLYINDPSGEFYILSPLHLQKYFTGNILVVNCVEKVSLPPRTSMHAAKRPLVIHALFLLFIILGFAFLGVPDIDLLSYIFFTVAALLKIVEQQLIISAFVDFDIRYIGPKLNTYKKDFPKNFLRLQKAKEQTFTYPLRLFSGLSTLTFITILLIINNLLLLIVALYLFIFALIETRMLRVNKNKEWQINSNYDNLLVVESSKREELYLQLIKDSACLAKKHVYRNVIVHFSLGVLIIVLMYLSANFTLNFLTFYFFGFSYYYFELKKLFRLLFIKKDYYKALNDILY